MAKKKIISGSEYIKVTPFQRCKELKPKLWKVFSKFIRLRDGCNCYTCSSRNIPMAKCHAGHFHPKSTTGVLLYFEEKNVHAQCISCNMYKSGNLAIYSLRLEQDYGMGILQELDAIKNKIFKPTPDWYEEKIAYYEEKVKELESRK